MSTTWRNVGPKVHYGREPLAQAIEKDLQWFPVNDAFFPVSKSFIVIKVISQLVR